MIRPQDSIERARTGRSRRRPRPACGCVPVPVRRRPAEVLPAVARRGAFIGRSVVPVPSCVNIGAMTVERAQAGPCTTTGIDELPRGH